MKSYEYAELYLNTLGSKGESELRNYINGGGDIHERDRDGMSAMDIACATKLHDCSMRLAAPNLIKILKSLGA